MEYLLFIFIVVFAIPLCILIFLNRKNNKKEIQKRSCVLANAINETLKDETVSAEEVFKTLKKSGIEPHYLDY